MKGYKGSGYNLCKAYKKYGFDSFDIEVLYKRILTHDTANAMEIYAIEKYKPEYNITKGGAGVIGVKGFLGKKHSEETKRKISIANKGSKRSEEVRRKMTEAQKGRITSEETRKKISESQKGIIHSEQWNKKISQFMNKVSALYHQDNRGLSWNEFRRWYKLESQLAFKPVESLGSGDNPEIPV